MDKWSDALEIKPGPTRKARVSKVGQKSSRGAKGGPALPPGAALEGVAKGMPQAIVKITGGGKGSKALGPHLTYISRHGELEMEDQDGNIVGGKGSHRDVVERWELTGSPMPYEGQYREVFQIVLSSQKGSDPASVLQAARAFAHDQFGGQHDYVMALHTPETDPSPKKSENSHVHLVVKARGHDGVRLNPRKADLHAYRLAYARHLRAHGIDAIAVKRQARFAPKGDKQSVYQMKKRGAALKNEATAKTQELAKIRAMNAETQARELYGDVVAALVTEKSPNAANLGWALQAVVSLPDAPRVTRKPPARRR